MTHRFTIDGSKALEEHLGKICQRILGGVQALVPARKLDALVLGGGYGRGEGGVLRTESGDRPYNDLEFYVFVAGDRLWNAWKYQSALDHFAEILSPEAGLHVEFKIDSLQRLRLAPVSMFSYDLVAAHRVLAGREDLFKDCEHHLEPQKISLAEATRLLFNRCSGLLLAKECLLRHALAIEEQSFIARNIAKAQLALGDAVLTMLGQYHWSCRERLQRLQKVNDLAGLPSLDQIQRFHQSGVEFKLHPQLLTQSHEEMMEAHRAVSAQALEIWLWLEARRLNCPFGSANEYALHDIEKCPETDAWKNCLLNLRTFGWKVVLDSRCRRYPRERLFNALALLLWNSDGTSRQ